jgi:hypothetical protein
MPNFRKKPIVIEARLFDGTNFDDLYLWGNPGRRISTAQILLAGDGKDPSRLSIETLEGEMAASVGDWIIKGVKGEFYPCKPDIFEATYEPVEEKGEPCG